jgi:hypothetical protein
VHCAVDFTKSHKSMRRTQHGSSSMLSRIGSVKEVPVEAEMRTTVSEVFHVGWFPSGPKMKLRTWVRCSEFGLEANRGSLLEKPG